MKETQDMSVDPAKAAGERTSGPESGASEVSLSAADAFLEKILKNYTSCYDIERISPAEDYLTARAQFHEHQSGYVLVRRAEMWSADRHEYVWFYRIPELTQELFRTCMERTLAESQAYVKPEAGHMCSNVVAIFICERVQPEAEAALRKYRYRKSFQFSLKGWMEVHAAAVGMEADAVTANSAARATQQFLESLLHPRTKKRFSLGRRS